MNKLDTVQHAKATLLKEAGTTPRPNQNPQTPVWQSCARPVWPHFSWAGLPHNLAQDRGVIRPQIYNVLGPAVLHRTWDVIALHMCVRITHQSCAGLLGNCLANMWTNYLPTGMAPAGSEATPPSFGNMES